MKQVYRKNIILTLLLVLVTLFSFIIIQTSINSFFTKEEVVNIENLHNNQQSYEKDIDFTSKDEKIKYLIKDFNKKDNNSTYKQIKFDLNDNQTNKIEKSNNTTISLVLLFGILLLVGMFIKQINKNI